jgi:AraC-like DNA-binding protein
LADSDLILSESALARLQPWRERLDLGAAAGAVWPAPARSATPEVRVWFHRHAELELNLVIAGGGTYLVGGRRVPFTAGTMLWLFPGQDHVLVRQARELRMHIAVWRAELVARTLGGGGGASAGAERALLEEDPAGRWDARPAPGRFRALTRLALEVAAAPTPAALDAGLGWLLMRAWQEHVSARGEGSDGGEEGLRGDLHPAVARAARLLDEEEGEEPRALPELAQEVGLSADHLARLFRRELGMSPTDYRNARCLERFIARARPGMSCLQLALQCGFGSYAQFHRVFRKAMGVGPRVWLQEGTGL